MINSFSTPSERVLFQRPRDLGRTSWRKITFCHNHLIRMNRCYSEHDYEPIAPPPPPSLSHPAMAPVVRITDTDMMPVADSDDSIDDRGARLPPELTPDGGVILPLDGKIEDSAMEGRELGGIGGDTSEEQEPVAQQSEDDGHEGRFLDAPTPYTESRTDGEVNTSQVIFTSSDLIKVNT